jgi:hypothetical protein
MSSDARSFTNSEAAARRALVLRNMCQLMKSLGVADKFEDPDAWLDSIVERPRPVPKRLQPVDAQ